jgi:hypothetical protein
MEPPIGIEPMAYALQERCSTAELRRRAPEFIGSYIRGTRCGVSVKDDLLSDFKYVYPGLSRQEVERLLTLLDQSASTEASMGLSIATAVKPMVPEVAGRIESYSAGDVDEYVRMLRGAAVLLLQQWQAEKEPPAADDVADRVAALEAES